MSWDDALQSLDAALRDYDDLDAALSDYDDRASLPWSRWWIVVTGPNISLLLRSRRGRRPRRFTRKEVL